MQSLESMEKGTPEFQRLTPDQQIQRRRLFTAEVYGVVTDPTLLGLTPQEAFVYICQRLEFHLTGKIDNVTDEQEVPRKRKR